MATRANGVAALLIVAVVLLRAVSVAQSQSSSPPASPLSREGKDVTALTSASVYWVGHSLMETKATSQWGQIDLMTMVGVMAKARGVSYRMGDHTLWGTPLSGNWRGRPHTYDRDASAMVAKREAFERDAASYDTLVATEVIPAATSVKGGEFSAYYLRRFYCTLKTANPRARVFLYQSWINFQGGGSASGISSLSEWRSAMARERAAWIELAETASRPDVRSPGPHRWLDKIGWNTRSDAGCRTEDPILIVPVGDALVRIFDRTVAPKPGDIFQRTDGSSFEASDFFANPYLEPAGSPSASRTPGGRRLRHSDKPHDDIHPSLDGIYIAALVHFAALYRQSPVGLPHPAHMGEGLARTLQCIAWQTVNEDPLAGVSRTSGC